MRPPGSRAGKPAAGDPFEVPPSLLLAGFGAANQAAARALMARGHGLIVFDDRGDPDVAAAAASCGLDLEVAPDGRRLVDLVRSVGAVIPTPGMPEHHPVLAAATSLGVPTASEFDLAGAWDSRPIAAVTGTSGKTTVTEMIVAALECSGVGAVAAGNNDLPLVSAVERTDVEVFVVEASSFRLSHSRRFEADAACWLNFAPDHLDVHSDAASYEAAKARLWQCLPPTGTAVANRRDPTVMSHLRDDRAASTFSDEGRADWWSGAGVLTGPDGPIMAVGELRRSMPHDIANALAAAATATLVGATAEGVAAGLRAYEPGAHRVQRVATIEDVTFYDDSKATTPHATVAALRSFDTAVLIAGGRNKGLDLRRLRDAADRVSCVVAFGEAADEVAEVFASDRPVLMAEDMTEAVELAATAAKPGTAVLLSPACASFDGYSGYAARGEDFARAVNARARPTSEAASR
ncbi:MAG: UDP-N-acetylmuramoyl-L-alanine--D-glutamate ligase [Acidimicrobiaceae bacterium]|nr:UDP-N-acetylmuramoyl-L-alanine--D-glutamate ligase [Acidimicrobiaceae bacterium]MYE96396.1 UDP-N-acetylmuramoyl-L-alanine--D-glutamate ligase [Acidimicrobiaceae bacterium]MYH42354.1 UDP-N-acetylmuramoyl-L-alanine--D-glutamate ligase [Acidimicrobiaceae bacterium]MYI53621.1 UDP-N-acetylmuramoyl-L-alanine--D-glutamate ligase [Acidimicrobiaceae bacterium]MYJ80677.1 UDP-N-acetylmuramoyl-L-alanine--D-glutamate ligase [Acidimicrobiaceae bacterium]